MVRKSTNRRLLTWGFVVFLISFALASAGNAQVKKEAKKDTKKAKKGDTKAQFVQLAWPEPPETPRIKFTDILASDLDVGRKVTGKESFRRFLTGEKPQLSHIYQPRDVVVSDDGKRIYASDFGAAVVFVFDREAKKIIKMPASYPFGLALDDQENLYIAEEDNRRILVFDRAGNNIRTITHEKLIRPTDITIDRARNRLYVADPAKKDSPEHSVKIFDLEGNLLGTIGKGKGECQGCLFFPTYVAVDKDGNVYVTSTLSSKVVVFDLNGNYLRDIGHRGDGFGMFDKPKGVALDSFGNVYVVDSGWSNVQIFNPQGEVLLFFGGRGDYPGLLKNPTGITIDKNNNIYVADFLNYRVTVYQLVNTKAEDSYVKLPDAGDVPEKTVIADQKQSIGKNEVSRVNAEPNK